MTTQCASGSFDVTLSAQPLHDAQADSSLARRAIEKTFHGDLDATSRGEMLSAMGGIKGSAGYVAIERVSGTLHGRRGSFSLQHSGVMTRGVPQLSVSVVPDSGSDELRGISGQMQIRITDGAHFYSFDYQLGKSDS